MKTTLKWLLTFAAILSITMPTFAQEADEKAKVAEKAQKEDKAEKKESKKLLIGSKAPNLDIEHWVSDNDGAFKHITEFEDGKVYVVEFWATWCGPCIAAMPHISELQKTLEKKGVQIISVSDEDLETVEGFLEREVRGADDGSTYADLTSNYCLTTDPDESVHNAYMKAAGQNGIPTAFVVGKKGHIEWIGHPMEIDKVLDSVLDDKWDRDAFAVTFKEKQAMNDVMMRVSRMMQRRDSEGALEILEEAIGKFKSEAVKSDLKGFKVQILVSTRGEGAAKAFTEWATENKKNGQALNQFCWGIYEMSQQDDLDKELISAATQAAEWATEAEPESGAILDTLAHLYWVQGKLEKAIEVQKNALKKKDINSMKDELEDFLDQLLDEKDELDESDK